ncbi:U1 small nuclear ribonucleoprotein C [Monocercomonoides exilis]|uniref:U1 small nuclear ribonucleoprotein C n=1 Tax=Monocercomonoides exilis TaxID=2049356 RepID=UPI003559698A|nr:U1 small nuclear ribonucleoprotein C [Monocercomonoides exilis]|eukprot:MONOS_11343.1-p1 / transcript=MONOS_11343.1 / gene=MONOS_11343 / organism=Monocercomonoides_exilis_PA203 / gene_product=U1 small nuclear ribonucleoprotein C / transcript_product=U1 small nuclear ribonucleoprotein C / location=Mono_scaffold00564:14686-15573(-) / protein_length=250 / sequence_SO=supercontig / SO=protein_coding / is_pseudo=false
MPKYYCDYCDVVLTHDSLKVRRAHNSGQKHQANVYKYYSQFLKQQPAGLGQSIPGINQPGASLFAGRVMHPAMSMPFMGRAGAMTFSMAGPLPFGPVIPGAGGRGASGMPGAPGFPPMQGMSGKPGMMHMPGMMMQPGMMMPPGMKVPMGMPGPFMGGPAVPPGIAMVPPSITQGKPGAATSQQSFQPRQSSSTSLTTPPASEQQISKESSDSSSTLSTSSKTTPPSQPESSQQKETTQISSTTSSGEK